MRIRSRNWNKLVTLIIPNSPLLASAICIGVVLVLICVFTVTAMSLVNKSGAESASPENRNQLTADSPRSDSQRPGIESEIITITPHGFEPREITRPKGTFLLIIEDRSGLPNNTPQLNRQVGGRLRDITVRREEPNWDDLIDLQPGRYILSEAGHPDWTCRITITAQ